MSTSPLFRTTAHLARKHSRVSVIASAVAAAGVLGAIGFASSAAAWGQASDNVTAVHAGSPSTSGQSGNVVSGAVTGAEAQSGKAEAGAQLDAIRSALTTGTTGPNSSSIQASAQGNVFVTAARQQAAQQAAEARAKAKAVAAARARAAAEAKPYLIYDSVTPSTIPSGEAAAVYANGAYAASESQTAGHRSVLWIDTNGSDPAANVLDVEPGDATPAGAGQWVQQRLSQHPSSVAVVYTMQSDWQEVKDNVALLPGWMQSRVRYWIADPTGVPHVLPGASATQWYWGNSYDITTANPDFVR